MPVGSPRREAGCSQWDPRGRCHGDKAKWWAKRQSEGQTLLRRRYASIEPGS